MYILALALLLLGRLLYLGLRVKAGLNHSPGTCIIVVKQLNNVWYHIKSLFKCCKNNLQGNACFETTVVQDYVIRVSMQIIMVAWYTKVYPNTRKEKLTTEQMKNHSI